MNVLEKILEEIKKLKYNQDSTNQDYITGYMSALSTVEGVIAGLVEAKDIYVLSNDDWTPTEESNRKNLYLEKIRILFKQII